MLDANRHPVIDATADLSHVYPSERLWFVRSGVSITAVMAVSSDDALMDVSGGFPSRADVEALCAGRTAAEIFQAAESMNRGCDFVIRGDAGMYMGLKRA